MINVSEKCTLRKCPTLKDDSRFEKDASCEHEKEEGGRREGRREKVRVRGRQSEREEADESEKEPIDAMD